MKVFCIIDINWNSHEIHRRETVICFYYVILEAASDEALAQTFFSYERLKSYLDYNINDRSNSSDVLNGNLPFKHYLVT